MKKCPFCAEDVQDEAKVCKHCSRDIGVGSGLNKQIHVPKGCSLIFIVLAALFIFYALGKANDNDNRTSTTSPSTISTPAKQSKVEILSQSEKTESANYLSIVGEVKNTGSVPVSFVKLTATFYDSANSVVDTQFTYADNASFDSLQPQATTPFKLSFEKIAYDHYKLDVTWND